jgi:hypothetical protein
MKTSYMPKAKSDIHLTPDRVWDMIRDNFGYQQEEFFDPCPVNPKFNGLDIDWYRLNYINPPYSNLPLWVEKAITHSKSNNYSVSIMLLPCKTDQQWFHDIIENNFKIIWIRRRLKFKNNKWSATQPHFLCEIKSPIKMKGYLEEKRN